MNKLHSTRIVVTDISVMSLIKKKQLNNYNQGTNNGRAAHFPFHGTIESTLKL